MAWEQIDTIFPRGLVELPTGQIIANNRVKNSEIKTIFKDQFEIANKIITRQDRWLWGEDGEFAIVNMYDVYAAVPHPEEGFYPLNVYGQLMVNDYISFNNIDLNEYNPTFDNCENSCYNYNEDEERNSPS